ncbi:low temperature requirement protein A [Xanthobacter dioxanivorans]|uniref:Low temperature requirement protein A n=1 Tax=Xanthobacter dioxanivorans TaxID=2528964 RepID=A0A974PQ45_9HYPH|nr:low temperature requirement protein A [Xanthobacter dioxanivorans]QRG07667.1 low temperature requirement protein A [Xanthobacter dioxanivorans]
MTGFGARGSLLREAAAHGHHRVTFVELFFDLVFVFAITQLSHHLLHDLSLTGLAQTLVLFVAVWWAWIDTAWVTNWLDPDRKPVRLALLVLMLVGLVLSATLPKAFHDGGLPFALAYATFQMGRSAFTIWAVARHDRAQATNFTRILSWQALASALWIAGAFLHDGARLGVWALAAVIDSIAAATGFFVPGLGASKAADWNVEGGHLSERCALFIIIALGESVLVTGATASGLAWTVTNFSAFVVAFVGTVAMWWIYFDTGSERASSRIAHAQESGHMARLGYTYVHQIIVLGIIGCALSDELILAHPGGEVSPAATAAIVGGPALYLLGCGLFKYPLLRRFPLSHLAGLVLLAPLAPFAGAFSPLGLAAAGTAALLVVAAWESLALRRIAPRPAD